MATADFSGDGKADLAVAGYDPNSSVPVFAVYLNQGGTFGTPTVYPFSGTPAGIAAGDFLGNGKQDIAVVDSSTNTLDVFLNDGSGNFTLGGGASLGGSSGDTQIVSADFNGDGKDDVAALDPTDNSVVVFASNGDGSFSSDQSISVPSPIEVATGDFTGDGHPDLAILSSDGAVYVALNNGSGQFSAPTEMSLGLSTPPTGLISTALTAGGRSDLVAYGSLNGSGEVSTLVSQSGGTFGAVSTVQVSIAPSAVVAGEFTGSGSTDLAALSSDGSLQILPGNGDGTFGTPQAIFTNTLGSGISQALSANFAAGPGIAYLSSASGFQLTTDTSAATPVAQTITPTLSGTLPSSVVAGVPFTARENLVLTAGSSAASGTATATLLLSPDASASDSVLTLGSVGGKVALKAGRSKTFSIRLPKSIPTTVAAGQYHVLIKLTDTAGVTETIDSGKTVSVAAPVVDLNGSFVKTPTSVKSGRKFTLTLLVSNGSDANVAAAGALPIEFASSPDGLTSDATPLLSDTKRINLKPGKSVRLTVTTSLSATAYLLADLDPDSVAFPDDIAPVNSVFTTSAPISVS